MKQNNTFCLTVLFVSFCFGAFQLFMVTYAIPTTLYSNTHFMSTIGAVVLMVISLGMGMKKWVESRTIQTKKNSKPNEEISDCDPLGLMYPHSVDWLLQRVDELHQSKVHYEEEVKQLQTRHARLQYNYKQQEYTINQAFMVLTTNFNGEISAINPNGLTLLQKKGDSILGVPLDSVIQPFDSSLTTSQIWTAVQLHQTWSGLVTLISGHPALQSGGKNRYVCTIVPAQPPSQQLQSIMVFIQPSFSMLPSTVCEDRSDSTELVTPNMYNLPPAFLNIDTTLLKISHYRNAA